MAVRRGAGLSDEQVERLRAEVAAGRRPRVRVAGPQFPEATAGAVLRVGDPGVDGAEFVVVRVKVGSVTDELGFAPAELSMGSGSRASTGTVATPSKARVVKRSPVAKSVAAAPTKAVPAVPALPAAKAVSPSRRPGAVPAVSITLASAGTAWSVSAQRGARAVVKKAPLAPGIVAAVVALLGQPAIEEAVAAVNDSARGKAEQRAAQLRAELAEVEAVLSSHRRPR